MVRCWASDSDTTLNATFKNGALISGVQPEECLKAVVSCSFGELCPRVLPDRLGATHRSGPSDDCYIGPHFDRVGTSRVESVEVNGFDWWGSQKPREDAARPPVTTVEQEPTPESISSVPFMRTGRKVTFGRQDCERLLRAVL
jgi:hypothetical protein